MHMDFCERVPATLYEGTNRAVCPALIRDR